MARGFESKSVQSQWQDGEDERARRKGGQKQRLDVGEIERQQRRSGLELSRRRVVNDLEAASDDRRRASLRAALDHLDAELAKFQ